jgi:hypothetical protein
MRGDGQVECGATLTLLTAAHDAATAGDARTAAATLGRLLPYVGESATAWTAFYDAVTDAFEGAVRTLAEATPCDPTAAAAWRIFADLAAALQQIQGHLDVARTLSMTAVEFDELWASG